MPLDNLEPTDTFDIVETKIDAAIDAINEHLEDSGWIDSGVTASGDVSSVTDFDYRKIGKTARLRGNIILDSSVSAENIALFTLPVGYRPAISSYFTLAAGEASNVKIVQCYILSNGTVGIQLQTPGTGYNSYIIGFDGVSFLVD
jgi:hypothetical protein